MCFTITHKMPHKIRITQKKLLEILSKLPENTFVKINKTLIVNISNVQAINDDDVTMINNTHLPIALLKRSKIKNLILSKI